MIKHESLYIETKEYNTLIRLTDDVKKVVQESGIKDGVVFIISAHTTTGITVNEGLECLEDDLQNMLCSIAPEDGSYYHGRFLREYGSMASNPTGHLKSHLTGNHVVFPLVEGRLHLGPAQDIYLCEFDGPQEREIMITIMGE